MGFRGCLLFFLLFLCYYLVSLLLKLSEDDNHTKNGNISKQQRPRNAARTKRGGESNGDFCASANTYEGGVGCVEVINFIQQAQKFMKQNFLLLCRYITLWLELLFRKIPYCNPKCQSLMVNPEAYFDGKYKKKSRTTSVKTQFYFALFIVITLTLISVGQLCY